MREQAPQQLPLGLRLDDSPTLDNFHCAPANRRLLQYLRDFVGQPPAPNMLPGTVLREFVWICAAPGAGKSHLLQALCALGQQQGNDACYLSLQQTAAQPSTQQQQALQRARLVALDDVEVVIERPYWQRALFSLYNEMAAQPGRRLLVASSLTPQRLAELGLAQDGLADFFSRWQTAVVMPLQPLSDDDKRAALQLRARGLGLELGDDVLQFLLSRSGRGMHSLLALLDALDRHSLATRRRVTVPLIKSLTGW